MKVVEDISAPFSFLWNCWFSRWWSVLCCSKGTKINGPAHHIIWDTQQPGHISTSFNVKISCEEIILMCCMWNYDGPTDPVNLKLWNTISLFTIWKLWNSILIIFWEFAYFSAVNCLRVDEPSRILSLVALHKVEKCHKYIQVKTYWEVRKNTQFCQIKKYLHNYYVNTLYKA